MRSRRGEMTEGFPCCPQDQVSSRRDSMLLWPWAAWWPPTCLSDTRASQQPGLQKLWREAQSGKWERGHRACGGERRDSTTGAPTVDDGRHSHHGLHTKPLVLPWLSAGMQRN